MLNDQKYYDRILTLLCLPIIIVCISIVYHPATGIGFSNPDDHWMLLKNDYVHPDKYSLDYFNAIFHRVSYIQYSPLNTFYYSLIYKINGFDPYYFHIANVVIHLINTILVFVLSKQLLSTFNIPNSIAISLISSFLWGICAVNVEPVVWISGSKILINTLLTLVSFIFFIKGIAQKQSWLLIMSFIAFFLSFFFKERAIITPVLFFLFIFFYNFSPGVQKIRFNKAPILLYLSLLLLSSILFGLFTITVNYNQSDIIPPILNYSPFERVLLTSYCFSFYFYSLILPFELHYHYFFPFHPMGEIPLSVYLSVFGVLLACIMYYWIYRKSNHFKFYLFLFCLFIAEIFLQLQIIPVPRPAIMADRFMYLPAIPLLITFTKLVFDFLKNNKLPNYILILLFSFFAISLIFRSNSIVQNWTDLNLIK